MDEQQVSLGEVYRLCLDIRRNQEANVQRVDRHLREHLGRLDVIEKMQERLKVYGFLGLVIVGVLIDWFKRKVIGL